MSSFTDYLENALLNHVFRNTALTSPTSIRLALFTAMPSDAGGGTEVSGSGYARQPITFGAPSGGVIANTALVSFTAAGGNFGTIVGVGFFDALTGGNMVAWDDLPSSLVVNNGDTINFAVGALTVGLT